MKLRTTKLNFLIFSAFVLLVMLLTGFGWKGWIKEAAIYEVFDNEDLFITELHTLSGTSEYYYKPAGESRLWHVVNKYNCSDSATYNSCNNSSYTFTADSVYVVNEYVSVPEQELYTLRTIIK